jgi:radical SAM superfamily enzyme YgiQ (UPF0313 family)
VNVLLIATYELGRPSFGLAQPAAWLREQGATVSFLDLSVSSLDREAVEAADLIAVHLPMHTATRLALEALPEIQRRNPRAHLCFYGLYAPLHADHLLAQGADSILGGEVEEDLAALARDLAAGAAPGRTRISTARLRFRVPDREGLPPLERYARLLLPGGGERLAGYTEASRGCRHPCRHCPIVPVYEGRFRIVPAEVVLEDIRRQYERGARHVTFGDPDFLNGPGHAVPLVEALHREWPDLTYDVTVKVEHLRRHGAALAVLKRTGCVFVTTALESIDDRLLRLLRKGHTRADAEAAIRRCDALGLEVAPTFVPFTPWTTLAGYRSLLRWLVSMDLVERVAPIQLAIRLLIPPGSKLLDTPEGREVAGPLDPAALVHPWSHPDARMDELAEAALDLVEEGEAGGWSRRRIFASLWSAAHEAGEIAAPVLPEWSERPLPHRLSEAWYCCAEPARRGVVAP